MENLLTVSVGLGLITSLLFSEMLGIAAGGMIVPGYIALYLNNPATVVLTLFVSWLTYFSVRTLSSVMIIYGRRKTVVTLLLGFILGYMFRTLMPFQMEDLVPGVTIIGYIIPGLIAIWIERQGLVETYAALITSSVIVRLLLILITGGEMSL